MGVQAGRALSAALLACSLWLTAMVAGTRLQAQELAAVPDVIYFNGNVITVDAAFSVQQSFAVRGDRFLAVGSNASVRRLAGSRTRRVDLKGATVIPGLSDGHDHLFGIERLMRGVDLLGATSKEEVLLRMRRGLAGNPPGEALVGSLGWRAPVTRQDLDSVSVTTPIVLFRFRRGAALLNSAALDRLGVSKENPSYKGVRLPVDSTGEPTGELWEFTTGWPLGLFAADAIVRPLSAKEEEEAILRGIRQRNSLGITSFRDLTNFPGWTQAYFRVWQQGKLNARVSLGVAVPDFENPEKWVQQHLAGSGFGDNWLRIDSISEDPFPPLELTAQKFMAFARELNRLGWRASPHVANDGIEAVLEAYEAADRDSPIREKRWVVEHAPALTPAQMDRFARLGVIISIQAQAVLAYEQNVRTMGKEQAERHSPAREMIEHGLTLISGNDIAGPTPESTTLNSPFIRLHAFVTRKAPDGRVIAPEQRVSRADALRFATINHAYATFEEKVKGSIEAGKLADFVILSGDYLSVPEDEILQLRPVATYVGGRKVFAAADAGPEL